MDQIEKENRLNELREQNKKLKGKTIDQEITELETENKRLSESKNKRMNLND